MTNDSAKRTNYIFIDYENVQEVNLDLIAGKAVKVYLVVGQRRKSLPSALARQIHRYHDQVEWIESQGASSNALDLVLAYQVGLQAQADPKGYFHILARDKDYDPLIQHLRANGILASRDEEFSKIPVLVTVSRLTLDQRVDFVVERFKKNKVSRPARRKSLLTSIHALLHKELPPEQVEQIATVMAERKLIEFTAQGGVTYRI